MRQMNTLSKVFRIAATGAVSMMLAACYGTPAAMYGSPVAMYGAPPDDYWRTLSLRVKNVMGEPIEGIRVSFIPYSGDPSVLGNTDSAGELLLDYDVSAGELLGLDDTDGPDNGGDFQSKAVDIPPETYELDAVLEEKTDTP